MIFFSGVFFFSLGLTDTVLFREGFEVWFDFCGRDWRGRTVASAFFGVLCFS